MTLIDAEEQFIKEQRIRLESEIEHWYDFARNNNEGVYLAFSEQRREGQTHVKNNQLQSDRADTVRDYLTLPDVAQIDGVWVDLASLQIPYNCMWKSCRLTGHYCCKVTSCTANTETSAQIMKEAGKQFSDKYDDEVRKAAIRRENTHTKKLNHNRRIDGHCVFGEERTDTSPSTGEEHPHIHCNLHEAAYERDLPMHLFHSIGPSLFPADILIVDGDWFLTAASTRAKEKRVTRWWVTSDETICTNHGDSKPFGILQHPDFDALFSDVLGRDTLDSIQETAYGQTGAVEPEIQDGWIRHEERGLTQYTSECRNCDGSGCSKCDGRGEFINWKE